LTFPRSLRPELLDQLEAADPRAVQSRRDLQTVNVLMGNPRILARALRGTISGARLIELGTGDGTLLLSVAKRLGTVKARVRAVLVDRRPSLSAETRASFDRIGWDVEALSSDVFEWLKRRDSPVSDVTIANLFLHHFEEPRLAELLGRASRQTRRFIACEPLRSRAALAGASLLRFVGCNDVTLHDAEISVRAGFRDRELSAAWPRDPAWRLTERRSGPFTHTFIADHVA
jgi:hypothetical protein